MKIPIISFLSLFFLFISNIPANILNKNLFLLSLQTSNKLYEETVKTYDFLLKKNKSFFLQVALASSLYKTGEKLRAKNILHKLLKMQPFDGAINYYLGVIYYEEKDFQKSFFFLEKAHIMQFKPYHAKYLLALIDYEKSKYKKSILKLTEVAEKSLYLRQRAFFYIGVCSFNLKNDEKKYLLDAEKAFQETIKSDINTIYAKLAMDGLEKIISFKKENNQKHSLNISLGFGSDKNLTKTIADSLTVNAFKASLTGYIIPYSNNIFKLKTYYHNYSQIPLSLNPSNNDTINPSHLFKGSFNFNPKDFLFNSLYIDLLLQKDLTSNDLTRIKIGSENVIKLADKFISGIDFSYFVNDYSIAENKIKNLSFEIYQQVFFKNSTPFIKYQFAISDILESGFKLQTDKLLLGVALKNLISNYSFTPYLSRTYKKYKIDLPDFTIDEVYFSIEKNISQTFSFFFQGGYEKHRYKNPTLRSYSSHFVGTGIKAKL